MKCLLSCGSDNTDVFGILSARNISEKRHNEKTAD